MLCYREYIYVIIVTWEKIGELIIYMVTMLFTIDNNHSTLLMRVIDNNYQ